jgi:hypothetical protein
MNPGWPSYLAAFFATCLLVSLVMNGVRLGNPRTLASETARLFLTISFGIFAFSLIVWVLEWILIRPLV